MKKIFKSLLCIAILGASMLQSCSAFFLGSDKYTKEEYAEAGITWKHNIILPDKYYYNGQSISQLEAEKIVKDRINTLNLELDYILFTILYINFIKNEKKNKEAQIKELKIIYKKINKKISHCTNLKKNLKSQIISYIQELTNGNSKVS